MVKDYGFEENDIQFLFITVNEEKVELRKNRNWFFNAEIEDQDYDVSYSILVDGKTFISFPKEVDRSTVTGFAHSQFEEDTEATADLQGMYAEMEAERRFGA
jgi:hypothetical protein